MSKIPADFYLAEDVVGLSKSLLGKLLCTNINGRIVKAYISETEAYAGLEDKASHAYNGRRSNRTEIMYARGGLSYVYLCYGIHFLFNIVSNKEDIPHAILIRAVYPCSGLETMLKRRGSSKFKKGLFSGPGKITQAMGINLIHNGTDLQGDTIWLEDNSMSISDQDIEVTTRVGIDYAEEDALLPYRFILKKDPKMF